MLLYEHHKYYGIIFDQKLSVIPHMKSRCMKAFDIIKADKSVLLNLHCSFIRSKMYYIKKKHFKMFMKGVLCTVCGAHVYFPSMMPSSPSPAPLSSVPSASFSPLSPPPISFSPLPSPLTVSAFQTDLVQTSKSSQVIFI